MFILVNVFLIFAVVAAEQSRSCCKNGGTCILGSFCACPPFFTGRNCEYDQRIRWEQTGLLSPWFTPSYTGWCCLRCSVVRSCGLISHGEWVQKGCSYCRCGYGILHCFANIFHKDCGKTHRANTDSCIEGSNPAYSWRPTGQIRAEHWGSSPPPFFKFRQRSRRPDDGPKLPFRFSDLWL